MVDSSVKMNYYLIYRGVMCERNGTVYKVVPHKWRGASYAITHRKQHTLPPYRIDTFTSLYDLVVAMRDISPQWRMESMK